MADKDPINRDPIDGAYRQAETLAQEEAERSARRARILAAVAQDHAKRPAPRLLARGLVAASLLIVSGLLAAKFLALRSPPAAQAPMVAHVEKNKMMASASPPVAVPLYRAPVTPAVPDLAVPSMRAQSPSKRAALPEAPPPAAMEAAPPATATAPPPAAPPPPVMAAPPPPPANNMAAPSPAAPLAAARSDAARSMNQADIDQLGAAANAGRTGEVEQLLARHVPVDAPDAQGETALMKSIRGDQPATAALLLRHGASLDRKNKAGLSARDLAAQINDPALNQALGLGP